MAGLTPRFLSFQVFRSFSVQKATVTLLLMSGLLHLLRGQLGENKNLRSGDCSLRILSVASDRKPNANRPEREEYGFYNWNVQGRISCQFGLVHDQVISYTWFLCFSGWFSYTHGPYFPVLLWQERSSNSIFPKPASCPVGKFTSFSLRPPGEDAPPLTGFAKYLPLLLNVGDCGLATAAVWFFLALLGSPQCVFSLRLQEQPLYIYKMSFEAGGRTETELTHMINLKLPFQCGMSWPFLFYWLKLVTWLTQYHRDWELCSSHGEKGEWVQ